MGDDNFDPCECAWGHELAMRRLLSLLRQSQSDCTDTECYVDASAPPQANQVSTDYYIVMTIMTVVALLIHFWLSQNRRNQIQDPDKGANRHDSSGTPPTPPPATN